MDHNKYKELNTLSVYEELKTDEQSQLLHHLIGCPECLADFEEKRKLKQILTEHKLKEPDPALLNQARRELRIALANNYKKKFISGLFDVLGSFFSSNYKLILAGASMVIIGFFLGKFIFSSNTSQNSLSFVANSKDLIKNNAQITNVKFADNIAVGGEVEFSFDAVSPVHVKGNINDPKIQNIISLAMVNGDNPGVRLNSINLINSNTSGVIDKDIRLAVINVIKNDPNPGVRREALKLMKKIPYDDEIKSTLLYVLQFDKNTSMRIESINLLMDAQKEGHNFSKDDLNIFRTKLKQDNNVYIQYRVKSVLKENV
jgi:hypothetical protein